MFEELSSLSLHSDTYTKRWEGGIASSAAQLRHAGVELSSAQLSSAQLCSLLSAGRDSSPAPHVHAAAARHSYPGALTLYCEAYRQDEDFVSFLNRNVIAAGLHLRHFQNDLGTALLDQGGLVIILVIGKKDRRNRLFAQ